MRHAGLATAGNGGYKPRFPDDRGEKGMPRHPNVNLKTRGDRNAQNEDQVERQEALPADGER